MRPILVKSYGNIYPVPYECFLEVEEALLAWHIEDAVFYEKDMVRISFEGDYFPCDEVGEIFKKYHNKDTQGKLDCMDLEAWTLTRHSYQALEMYRVNTSTLDKALENV